MRRFTRFALLGLFGMLVEAGASAGDRVDLEGVLRDGDLLRAVVARYQQQVSDSYETGLFVATDARMLEGMRLSEATKRALSDGIAAVSSEVTMFLRDLEKETDDPNLSFALRELETELMAAGVVGDLVEEFERADPALVRIFESLLASGEGSFASVVLRRLDGERDWLWSLTERTNPVDDPWVSAAALAKLEGDETVGNWLADLGEQELRSIVEGPSPYGKTVVKEATEILGGRDAPDRVDGVSSSVIEQATRELYRSFLTDAADVPADVEIVEFLRRCALSQAIHGKEMSLATQVAEHLEEDPSLLRWVLMAEPEKIGTRPWVISLVGEVDAGEDFFATLLGRLRVQKQRRLAIAVVERVRSPKLIDDWLAGLERKDLAFIASRQGGFEGSIRERANALWKERSWMTEVN